MDCLTSKEACCVVGPDRSRSDRRYRRRLCVEGLESRKLLAAELYLDPLPPQVGNDFGIAAELRSLVPDPGEKGILPLADLIGEVETAVMGAYPLTDISRTRTINGLVYTVGVSGTTGFAIVWNPETGEQQSIELRSLTASGGLGYGNRVYDIFQIDGNVFFGGSSTIFNDSNSTIYGRAVTWDTAGNLTLAPFELGMLPNEGYVFSQINEANDLGLMTGEQNYAGYVWTPSGGVHRLPITELAQALGYVTVGFTITEDGQYIGGRIGADAANWKASGNPATGEYELVHYAHNPHFPYRFERPDDGFGPHRALFALDSDLYGTIVTSNYSNNEWDILSGAWSVETGEVLQTFGYSAIKGAINIDGNVYVATNDFTENSGAIWLLGQDQPVYLLDILGSEFENPVFTSGGLFVLPDGIGVFGRGKVDGVETNFIAEIKFADETFEYLVDINLDGEFDVSHFGSARTDIPIRIDRSGSYMMRIQARRGGEVVAEAFTTIDVTPYPAGTLSLAQIPMDTSGDGILTPLDALLVLTHISRVNRGAEPFDLARFDVNRDGAVTPLDALLMLNQMRQGDGPGQQLPSIELANDSGIAGDGFTNDPSIIGELPIHGEVYLRMGDTVRNVTEARSSEGHFVLAKEELFELFPEASEDGEQEVRIWVGIENAPESLQTRLQFAYQGTPPHEFEIFGLASGKLTWEAAQGASRYDVGYRVVAGGTVNWISQDLRQTSTTLDSSIEAAIEAAIELIVRARDAAGNQTEQTFPLMSA